MFRFTIRDVLWLTVVVALVVGWWLDHRVQTARSREQYLAASAYLGLRELLEDRGYKVESDARAVTLYGGPEAEVTRMNFVEP